MLSDAGFRDVSVELGYYNGVYSAIDSLIRKYGLTIDLNENGESVLPVWVAKSFKG